MDSSQNQGCTPAAEPSSPQGQSSGNYQKAQHLHNHRQRTRSKEKLEYLSVADVYDVAADIGREFEKLIDSHGPEHVTELMQKVISALEHLEKMSTYWDSEKLAIEKLQAQVLHLELEDSKKLEERQRTARELEQIEEHYKQETRDLLTTVKRLQDENRKLASSLAAAAERDSAFSEDEAYFEVDLVNKLESVVEKQRNEIKKLDQSVIDLKSANDETKRTNEKLTGCTRDLRRKLRSVQCQLYCMVDERAELTAQVHDHQREISHLHTRLGLAAKECEDLSGVVADHEKNRLDVAGKVVYDAEDPDRPRFSLPELRDILHERNTLKARVSDLEDELAIFRPDKYKISSVASPSRSPRIRIATHLVDCDCSYHSRKIKGLPAISSDEENEADPDDAKEALEGEDLGANDSDEYVNPEDLPVQGPLPQEPEDAPFRKCSESGGIRRLFRELFVSVGQGVPDPSMPPRSQWQRLGSSAAARVGPASNRISSFNRWS